MGAAGIFAFGFLLFLCVPFNQGMPSEPSAKPALDLSALLSNKFIRCSHKCRQDLNCLGITIFQAFVNSTVETEDDIFWCRFDLQRRPEDLAKGSVVYQVMQRDKLARAQAKPVNGRGKRSVRRKPKTGKLNGSNKRLSPRDELDGQASTLRHVPIIRPGPSSQISEILVPNVPQPTLQVQVPVLKPTQPQATTQTTSELFQPVHPITSTLGTPQAAVSTIPALNLPIATNFVAGPGQETQQKKLTAAIPGQPQATTQILLNAVPLTSPPQQIIPPGAVPSAQTPAVGTSEPSIDVRTGLNELTTNASLAPTNDSSVTVAVQNASMTKAPGEITQDFKLPKNASHLQLQLPSVTFDFGNTSSAEINVTTIASVKTQDQNASVTSNKITASINPAEVKVHLVDTTPTAVLVTLRPQSLSTTEVPLEPSNETIVSREDLNANTTEKGPVDIDFESPTGVSNASEAEGRNPVGANITKLTVQGLPATTKAPELMISVAAVNATSTKVPTEEATSTMASVNITAGPTATSAPQNISAEDKTFGSSSTSTSIPVLLTSSTSAPALVTTALPSTTSKPTEFFSTETTTPQFESTTTLPTTTDLTSTLAEESTTVLPVNATEATTTETPDFLEESTTTSNETSTVTEESTTVVPETTTEAGTTTTEFVSAETSTIPAETSTTLPETTTQAMPNKTSIPLTTTTSPLATSIVVSQNTSLLTPQDSSTIAKVNVTITPTANVSHIRIEPVVRVEVFNHPANLTNTDLDTESGDIQTRITKVSKLVNITFNSLTSLLSALSGRPTPDALAHNDHFLQKPPPVSEQLEGPHATENINTEIPLPEEATTEFPILSSTVHHELVTLPAGSLRLDISPPVMATTTRPGNLSKHDDAGITEPRLGLVESSDSRPTSHFTTGGVAVANNSDAQRRSGTEPGVISIGSISSGNLTASNLTASTDNRPEAAIRTESKPELPTSPIVAFFTSKLRPGNASAEGSTVSLPSVSSTLASGVVPPSSLQIPNSTLSPPLVPSISLPPTSQSSQVVLLPQVSETQAVNAVEVSSILMPGVLVPAVPTILTLVSAATTSLPARATPEPSVPDAQIGSSEKDRLLSLMRLKSTASKSPENNTDTSSSINSTLAPSLIATIAPPAIPTNVPSLVTPTVSQLTSVSPSTETISPQISTAMLSPTDNAASLPIGADQQPGDSTMVQPPSVQKRVSVDDACVSEDAERFKRGVTATAFSVISGVPTLLSFVNGSNCVGTFSKNGRNGLRSLSSLFPGSFFTEQPRLISASFFFNNSLYLFDSGKEQTVARFVFDDQTGSYKQDEEYRCVSTERFLQEVCGVNSPPPFAIKAVAQVSQNDSSCVVFDKSGKLLISPRATEDARLLAKGLIALLDEEMFLYIESVHTWLDEPDPEKVYVFGSDKEVYEIVKDASAFKWAQGSFRVLPYDSPLHR